MAYTPLNITPFERHLLYREIGRRGGLAAARNNGKEFCQERSRKGGEAVKLRYGLDFYKNFVAPSRYRTLRTMPTLRNLSILAHPTQLNKLMLGT